MIYLLIEEYNNWMDYIMTTSTEVIMASKNKGLLEEYMNDNYSDDGDNDSSVTYFIKSVNEI